MNEKTQLTLILVGVGLLLLFDVYAGYKANEVSTEASSVATSATSVITALQSIV